LCCAQAERSVESLFTELASTGLVARVPPSAALSGHLGGCHLAGGALARAGADPGASPQQLRGALAEFCALPLLSPAVAARRVAAPPSRRAARLRSCGARPRSRSSDVAQGAVGGMQTLLHGARMLSRQGPEGGRRERARAPAVRAVLLYGAPRTGKSALVRAVAAEAGAALFDLSPRATDGKYPGKVAALMIHMVREARARVRVAAVGCPETHLGRMAALPGASLARRCQAGRAYVRRARCCAVPGLLTLVCGHAAQ